MPEDKRRGLTEDLMMGLTQGSAAKSVDAFSGKRVDDGTVLEVDLGDPDLVYVVTVASVPRVD